MSMSSLAEDQDGDRSGDQSDEVLAPALSGS